MTFACTACSSALEAHAPPAQLSARELRRILPELHDPTVLTESALRTDAERDEFRRAGLSFRLIGDFNRDGRLDMVVAGRFDNTHDPDDHTFVLLATKRNKHWQRVLLLRPRSEVVVLQLGEHPEDNMAQQGYRSIIAGFSVAPSDDYGLIYWDGTQYRIESGFDIIRRDLDRAKRGLIPAVPR